MINNPVVSSAGGGGVATIAYGIGIDPETTFVNKNGELTTTQDYTVQVPKNTIVRVSGGAGGRISAYGEYTFVCGNRFSDFAMFIYGNVDITRR